MNCKEAKRLLSAKVDGDLDALSTSDLEAHLDRCEECSMSLQSVIDTRALIAKEVPYYKAPPGLAESIERSIAPARSQAAFPTRALAFAACVLLALCVGWFGRSWIGLRQAESAVVLSHVHALMSGHLADVISIDKHTVKPWFNGKIDFSPPVTDFASAGFPLTGGRVDSIGRTRAAVLVYRRNKHVIDLYITRGAEASPDWQSSSRGYNVVHWQQGEFQLFAVSDLNFSELQAFVSLVKSSASP